MDMTDQGANPAPLTSAHKSYSVEDITAALDDMVQGDEFLNGVGEDVRMGRGDDVTVRGGASVASTDKVQVGTTDEAMDALTRALSGFPGNEDNDGYV